MVAKFITSCGGTLPPERGRAFMRRYAGEGHAVMLQLLASNGVDVNGPDVHARTPLCAPSLRLG